MYRKLVEDLDTILENVKFRHFSNIEAKRIGDKIDVNWAEVPVGEFRAGLTVELEHGKHDPQTDVTHDDLLKTGKIVLAHLKEDPKYYSRLRRVVKDVPSTW
jgi:hypothetical protein